MRGYAVAPERSLRPSLAQFVPWAAAKPRNVAAEIAADCGV
jgi:hypothetical protein